MLSALINIRSDLPKGKKSLLDNLSFIGRLSAKQPKAKGQWKGVFAVVFPCAGQGNRCDK